jgi:hypothetical protein
MSEKKVAYYTPVGKVKFPKTVVNGKEEGYLYHPADLNEKDKFKMNFSLILDPKDPKVAELLATLDTLASSIKKPTFAPYKKDEDKDDDGNYVENGLVAIPFTTYFPITFVDVMKKPCDVKVSWGSKIAVKFNTNPVNNQGKVGLGRYARAIQVFELSESNQDLSGFSEGAEGFQTASEAVEPWKE